MYENDKKMEALLSELAPESEPRFAPAHLLLAQQTFVKLTKLKSPQVMVQYLRLTRTHLEHALKLDEDNLGGKSMLGRVCMELRDYKEAAKNYEDVLAENPLVFRNLRICYQRTGETAKINGHVGKEAIRLFQTITSGRTRTMYRHGRA